MDPVIRVCLLAIVVVSCGPTVGVGADSGSTSSSSSSSSTTAMTSTTIGTNSTTTEGSSTSTTIGADSSGESTSGSSDATNGPCDICDPDTLPVECDLFEEDCARGLKCMPWASDGGDTWNALRCSPIDRDPDAVGEPCMAYYASPTSGFDSCELHAMCWNVDLETLVGECVAFCTGDLANPTCEDPSATCVTAADSVLALCMRTCHPLVPGNCDDDELCIPISGEFHCVSDASGEAGAVGDPCEYVDACDPGSFCANADVWPACAGLGCCAPFCDLDAAMPCPAEPTGLECVPWYEDGTAPRGYETLGLCASPE
jgi:hypothetical protein